jgi:hypothetical protein
MPYLGNTPSTSFATVVKDSFSGDGSTVAFTLSKVATTNSVSVFVENVRQEPTTAYAVSGTTLTFTAAPVSSSGNNIYVLHMNPTTTTTHPSAQALTATSGTFSGDVSIGDDLTFSSDGAVLSFGADADVTLTHVADQGLTLKSTATDGGAAGGGASGLGPILNLSTGDTDISAANQLGTINFQAPDEGTGTDAIAVVASITAIAQEDFAADANGTSLLLRTSDSGTNDGSYLELTNTGLIKIRKDSDTDYNANQTQNNVVLNLNNATSGASNCVGMSFTTESNGEQYITAEQRDDNGGSDLVFGARNGGSRSETMRLQSSNSLLYIPAAYSNTTGTGANMYIQSDGAFYRSTSSRRYKNTIKDATHGLAELLKLRSVTYKGNNDGDVILGGLIAEEVHDAGLTEFVQYNDDDEPDALSYGNMVSLCIKAIQEQQEQIKTLEAKVKTLESS